METGARRKPYAKELDMSGLTDSGKFRQIAGYRVGWLREGELGISRLHQHRDLVLRLQGDQECVERQDPHGVSADIRLPYPAE